MKKLILLFALFSALQSNATHLMGGQITSKNIGGLNYEVTLTLYRDTLGIPMYSTETIGYLDSSGVILTSHTIPYDTNIVHIGNGVERYQFIDTIAFATSGKYKAFYTNCCRNAAILNIPNASAYGMYLDVDILVDSTNSSPVFLNEPITVAQLNVPFMYNPLPFDVDGDSLSWTLDTPLDIMSGTTLGMIIPGYVLPFSDISMPFTLDPLTGEISFLPNTIGNFQVSVKAIEWRNGVQIGYIRRDMQLIVVPSGNTPVMVQTNTIVQRTTTNPIYVNVGESLTLTLAAINFDNGIPTVAIGGSAFLNTNATSWIHQIKNQNEVDAVVNWTPTLSEVSSKPYYISFRVGDYSAPFTFYNDYTFRVIITNNTTGINEVTPKSKKVYVKSINMIGQDVDPSISGFRIDIYSDGSLNKVYKQN